MSPDWRQHLRHTLATSSEHERPLIAVGDWTAAQRAQLDAILAAELRRAAVLVPVMDRDGGPTILLTRRSESLRQHKGQISFPGGVIDDNDASYAAAALREANEEVGLRSDTADVVGYLDDHPTLTGYRITPVVAIVAPFTPEVNPDEVADVLELPLSYLYDAARFEQRRYERGDLSVPYFELRHDDHLIWGATAGILWNLHRRLVES